MITDVLKWFLIIFFGLFIIWILSGGPQRGGGTEPIISAPSGVGGPTSTPRTNP
ncbi:MAG: hypothetical protein QG654_355 [Patescibacteria group bacterium]|jgi:hypothetical protein|nr:hypothetical protein [Patescibacteria group bacterium]